MTAGVLDQGDPGGREAALVPGQQFRQDVADPLRLAAAPVFDAGMRFSMIFPSNSPDYTKYYTFVNCAEPEFFAWKNGQDSRGLGTAFLGVAADSPTDWLTANRSENQKRRPRMDAGERRLFVISRSAFIRVHPPFLAVC